jgi:hypothetical protein
MHSSPNWLLEYPAGNRYQPVSLSFEVEVSEGTLHRTAETTEYGYHTAEEITHMDVVEHHRERIADAFMGSAAPFVR